MRLSVRVANLHSLYSCSKTLPLSLATKGYLYITQMVDGIIQGYSNYVHEYENQQKGVSFLSAFKVFESIARYRMLRHQNHDFRSFGRNFTNLKDEAEKKNVENFYTRNANFIYKLKELRNSKVHDFESSTNINPELLYRITYEHIVEFLKEESVANVPETFIGFTSKKPKMLLDWISQNKKSFQFITPKASGEGGSSHDTKANESSKPSLKAKKTRTFRTKSLRTFILILGFGAIAAYLFKFRDFNNTNSSPEIDAIKFEPKIQEIKLDTVRKELVDSADVLFKDNKGTTSGKETNPTSLRNILPKNRIPKAQELKHKAETKDSKTNQLIIGNGTKINNSDIRVGDQTVNNYKSTDSTK